MLNSSTLRPGPSSKSRRSAIKARKSITTRGSKDALDDSEKTIQAVKRHRKRRHTRLKEMAKEEEEGTSGESWLKHFTGEEITCPICSMRVRGDRDVVEAHVDACLASESHRQEEARQRELQHRQAVDDENWDEDEDGIGNYVGNLRGKYSVHNIIETYRLPPSFQELVFILADRTKTLTMKLISMEMTKLSSARRSSLRVMSSLSIVNGPTLKRMSKLTLRPTRKTTRIKSKKPSAI